jgi:hypothetical protein
MTHDVQIRRGEGSKVWSVLVDGHDIANLVTALALTYRAEDLGGWSLELELLVGEPGLDLDQVSVWLDSRSAAALRRLGWTPPGEQS